jgi:hypothetical protein
MNPLAASQYPTPLLKPDLQLASAPPLRAIAEVIHDIDLKDDRFGRRQPQPSLRYFLRQCFIQIP